MKKLFIYYSLTGNGDMVSDYFKKKGYTICKIKTKEPLPKQSFLRILSGGFKALINYKDKIDCDVSINEYDEIIIGSPIWNSRVSSPINAFLNENNLLDKKVNFIFYSGSGKNNKATTITNNKYKNAKIINLKEPLKNKDELDKLEEFL